MRPISTGLLVCRLFDVQPHQVAHTTPPRPAWWPDGAVPLVLPRITADELAHAARLADALEATALARHRALWRDLYDGLVGRPEEVPNESGATP